VNGWKSFPLSELVTFRRGLTYKKSDEVDYSDNAVLRANNIDRETGSLNLAEIRYIDSAIAVPESKRVERGSLLICTASGSKNHLGKVAIIENDASFAFGGFMGLLVPSAELNPKYLFYLTRSSRYGEFIASLSDGANINNLKFRDLGKLEVPLPPLAEQNRIVAVLDQAFAALDGARANAEANLDAVDELLMSGSRAVFESVRADSFSLGELCEIYQPKTISAKEMKADGDYVVFGANGRIGRYDKFNHEEPQLLVTCRGATCGSVNISEPFSWITGNAMVVRPKDERLSAEFLEQFFRGAMDWDAVITGAAQPQITRKSLAPTMIPLPTREIQDREAEALQRLQSSLKQVASDIEAKLDDIEDLRLSLLQKAFTGKLT
jgi:type I restriction enzyme, S subunit